jgi:hypothetical protein
MGNLISLTYTLQTFTQNPLSGFLSSLEVDLDKLSIWYSYKSRLFYWLWIQNNYRMNPLPLEFLDLPFRVL